MPSDRDHTERSEKQGGVKLTALGQSGQMLGNLIGRSLRGEADWRDRRGENVRSPATD